MSRTFLLLAIVLVASAKTFSQAEVDQFCIHGPRGAAGLGQRMPALEAESLVDPAPHRVAQ